MKDTTTAELTAKLADFQRRLTSLRGELDEILPAEMPDALYAAVKAAGMGAFASEASSALQGWARTIREDLESAAKCAGAATHVVEAAQHRAKRGNLDLLS